jgi:hypothetical protein
MNRHLCVEIANPPRRPGSVLAVKSNEAVEQRLGAFEIGRVEPFGKPAVNLGE